MAAIELSKRTLDKLEPGEKTYTVWDSKIQGFGVRVWTSGLRTFLFKHERRGKQYWITLGRYGEITFAQAQAKARKHRLQIADGQNPGVAAQARRHAPTVAELCDRFIAEHAAVKTKPRTYQEYHRIAERILKPKLGSLKVGEVTPQDAYQLHYSLSATPRQANLVLAVLSKMFNLAELWGWRPQQTNPCYLVQRMPEKRRERFLTEKELERLGKTLHTMEDQLTDSIFVFAAVRMLILTGARLNEILSLEWSMVDIQNGLLRLPDSKTGAKAIFLNPPALKVLKSLPHIQDNPYVFPGEREGSNLVNLEKPWRKIREEADIQGVRIHDLRHTFASMAAQSGLSLQIVGALLGHTSPSTTKRYSHFAAKPLQEGSNQVGEILEKALSKPARKTAKNGKP